MGAGKGEGGRRGSWTRRGVHPPVLSASGRTGRAWCGGWWSLADGMREAARDGHVDGRIWHGGWLPSGGWSYGN